MKLYMIVSEDEYELPEAVFDYPSQMAYHLGITPQDMRCRISHSMNCKHPRYVRVEIEDD